MAVALRVEEAWNGVSVEERFELVARAKAHAFIVALAASFLFGAIAYGFDNIWLLCIALVVGSISMSISGGKFWRRHKSELILTYLAVRSVSRRYAYAYKIPAIDIILIFRGQIERLYSSEEEKVLARERENVGFDTISKQTNPVWICLLRGAVLVLSERPGGAKLEYIAPINPNLNIRRQNEKEGTTTPTAGIIISGVNNQIDILVTSPYKGALYVFEKRLARLIYDVVSQKDLQEQKKLLEEKLAQKSLLS